MQESYLLPVEKRMQASEHWKVLGKEIAEEVQESIEKQSNEKKQNQHAGPVYISDVDQSSFGRAMYTVLTTEFVKHNVAITPDPNARFRRGLVGSTGCSQGRTQRQSKPCVHYFCRNSAGNFFRRSRLRLSKAKPHTEVIVTFRLKTDGVDSYRQTHIYAINDADIDHSRGISEQGRISVPSKTVLSTLPYE